MAVLKKGGMEIGYAGRKMDTGRKADFSSPFLWAVR